VRAEIVLLAADGMNNCAIAATLGVSRLTVGLWRKRLDGTKNLAKFEHF
jgi:transposase